MQPQQSTVASPSMNMCEPRCHKRPVECQGFDDLAHCCANAVAVLNHIDIGRDIEQSINLLPRDCCRVFNRTFQLMIFLRSVGRHWGQIKTGAALPAQDGGGYLRRRESRNRPKADLAFRVHEIESIPDCGA
jgi:hypothetical protein